MNAGAFSEAFLLLSIKELLTLRGKLESFPKISFVFILSRLVRFYFTSLQNVLDLRLGKESLGLSCFCFIISVMLVTLLQST